MPECHSDPRCFRIPVEWYREAEVPWDTQWLRPPSVCPAPVAQFSASPVFPLVSISTRSKTSRENSTGVLVGRTQGGRGRSIPASIKTRNEEHTHGGNYLWNHSSCLPDRSVQDLLHLRVRLSAVSAAWNMETARGNIPAWAGEQLMQRLQAHSKQQKSRLSQFLASIAHSVPDNRAFACALSAAV